MELVATKGYTHIWSDDLQVFADQFLDRKWNLAMGESFPSQNYCTKFTISGKTEFIMDDTEADFDSWLAGGQLYPGETEGYFYNHEPSCEEMMQYLYNMGLVPAGKYIVEVYW